jgi:threonine synthase
VSDGTRPATPRLVCAGCGRAHEWSLAGTCSSCGGLVDVEYDLARARIGDEGPPMERFRDLLPVLSRDSMLDAGEGNTRCLHARELGRAIGLDDLWVKVEGDNPTRTVKDRQGTVVIAALRELGATSFVLPSTGNSCTSLARVVARFPDMHMHVFVGDEFLDRVAYADAPNVSVYWLAHGSFVEASEAAAWFAAEGGHTSDGGFSFFAKREALKTVYLEAALQVPREIDVYVQGVSSGIGVYASHRAALQLRAMNRTQSIPRLVCVQEDTCDPMVRSFARGAAAVHADDIVAHPRGLAKATLRGDPSRSYAAVRDAVLASGGTMVSAGRDAIETARTLIAETEGLEICYASALTIAAARDLAARGWLARDALVLLNLTGADRPPSRRAADFIVERREEEWIMTAQNAPRHREVVQAVADEVRLSQRLSDDVTIDAATALLYDGLGLDSVAVFELLLAIEKRFDRRIEEHEVTTANLATVGSLAELVAMKLESSSG